VRTPTQIRVERYAWELFTLGKRAKKRVDEPIKELGARVLGGDFTALPGIFQIFPWATKQFNLEFLWQNATLIRKELKKLQKGSR
jgi:hypothetical protein